MTYLLPQEVPELLDFDTIPALTCQPDILLKDGSNVISPLKDLKSSDRFTAGPIKPEYIIVKERQKVQEQDSLKLRLRVTTTGSCGSASSSPSETISDNDVDVQQFLNLSTDFVVMEECKQVLEDSPETPPPVSDAPETPPPTVRSITSILNKPSPNKPSPNKQSKNIRNNVNNTCRAIPVPRTKLKDQKKEPNKSMYAKTALSNKVGPSGVRFEDMFHKSKKRLPKKEVEQTTSIDKSDKHYNQGAVIGSMERGPRMFGVRYGPCDSPLNKAEITQARDTKKHISLHDRLKKAKSELKTHKSTSLSGQNVMNNNQKLKINANQRAPKLPTTPPHSNSDEKYNSKDNKCTNDKDLNYRVIQHHPNYNNNNNMLSERRSPKDKSDLPPFKKIKIPFEETRWFEELRKEEQKWRKHEEKQIIPYVSPRPHLSVLNQGNSNNNNTEHLPSPPSSIQPEKTQTVKELYFQHHMYCSVEKPLFESDPEALKISEVYQLVLNTYLSLEAQRTTALQDIDKLENLKCQAVKRPYKFIKLFQKGELVFPKRQEIAKLPNINLTYKNKRLDLGSLNDPSENSKPRPSEQTYSKLKSRTYDKEDA